MISGFGLQGLFGVCRRLGLLSFFFVLLFHGRYGLVVVLW